MKFILFTVVCIIIWAYISTKGYQDGYRVGGRHSNERVEALELDLMAATSGMPEYSKRRLRENIPCLLMDIPPDGIDISPVNSRICAKNLDTGEVTQGTISFTFRRAAWVCGEANTETDTYYYWPEVN